VNEDDKKLGYINTNA